MVIVTTPQQVALLDSRKSITFSESLKVPVLGVVENMSGFTVNGTAAPGTEVNICLLYTSPSPRDLVISRMPSSA